MRCSWLAGVVDFGNLPAEAKKAAEDACATARDSVLQAVVVCK